MSRRRVTSKLGSYTWRFFRHCETAILGRVKSFAFRREYKASHSMAVSARDRAPSENTHVLEG